jgi:nucleoside-triphosphatase THEP1
MRHNIYLLVGAKQIGKTTAIEASLKNAKNNWAGVLMPVIQQKRHIFDISSKRLFNIEQPSKNSLAVGKYNFAAEPFEQVTEQVIAALGFCNNIIIDEIGPLELEQHLGFYNLLQKVLHFPSQLTILLVARPSVVNQLQAFCLPAANKCVIVKIEELAFLI